ncbi:MAG: GNAT family N-acetyltransferase [Methanotrichaceae archaeon]|nr:GNAT family N-acetyltransferase [Methanotrichaceae archaeon]
MKSLPNHAASISLRHDLRPGDVGYITYLHGTLYAQDQGWDYTFDAYVASPLAEFARSQSSRERIWILEKDGRIVGSAAVVKFSDKMAQLRWLLLDPSIRGQGIGRWLAEEALKFCRAAGYYYVFLWTVKTLTIATKLYQSLGFRATEEQTHELWGRIVTEVRYDLELTEKP